MTFDPFPSRWTTSRKRVWGGGMFWAIDLDDFNNDYPLITTVSRRLRGPDE